MRIAIYCTSNPKVGGSIPSGRTNYSIFNPELLPQPLSLPTLLCFETTTCLFSYFPRSGNALRCKCLSGGKLTGLFVPLEIVDTFG
jgi:hypothetical protein